MASIGQGQVKPEPAGRAEHASAQAQVREPDGPIEHTTASLGLWPWVQLAVQNGISVERFCELADVQVSALRDAEVRFSQPVANRVAQLAYAQFGPGAAMLAALTVEAGHFNLLELIARSAPTVNDGLEVGCRFFPLLHHGGYLRYEQLTSGGAAIRWQPAQSYVVHHGYVELTFAVCVLGIRRETRRDDIAPDAVSFRHAAPDDPAPYERVFGVAPRFDMPDDHVIFGREFVALPLTRENAAVHDAAARTGADLLDE